MTKEEFQELLRRYKAGDCSLDEIQQINNWFNKISDENLELNEFEKGHVRERMLSAIREGRPFQTKQVRKGPAPFFLLKVAASLLLVAMVVYLVSRKSQFVQSEGLAQSERLTDQIRHTNGTGAVMKVQLPDSSTVELKPNAEISYLEKWDGQKREVHLVGEAFFSVVKDSQRPFYVYGGEVVTKVTPNEKVEYFVSDKHWVTSLVNEPQPLPASNKEVDFVFNNAPIVEIKELIERTYSIDIIMENESSYSACTFTGDVSMMELYDLLNVICKSTNTNYEVKGTKILITGPGCQ
jgi:transmembrane sensor